MSATQRDTTPIQAALTYATRGWPVFPCHYPTGGGCSCHDPGCSSPAKHPRTPRGLHDATTRRDVIRRSWQRSPDANVAVRTGTTGHDGIVVIDIDPAHGGNESLAQLTAAHG